MDFWAGFAWGIVSVIAFLIILVVLGFIGYAKTSSRNHNPHRGQDYTTERSGVGTYQGTATKPKDPS